MAQKTHPGATDAHHSPEQDLPSIVRYWILRLLVELKGDQHFVGRLGLRHEDVARQIGLGALIDEAGNGDDPNPAEVRKALRQLYRNARQQPGSVPPRRPSRSSAFTQADHAFDFGIGERYRDLHARARSERSAWLKVQGISHKVAAQAALTDYNPYAQAARIGRVAPPMPEGYAEALADWRQQPQKADQKPVPKPQANGPTLPGGLQGFSF